MGLRVAIGQYSDPGRKPANQDCHGACIPRGAQLEAKGVALALADGISSSEAGRDASQAAVRSFLGDYYSTSEAWSVKTSVERVLAAANSWLFAQTQQGAGRYDRDRGWACTFSALVLKSRTAHLFHVGDARIYQLQGRVLEQLTNDHRVHAGGGQSYLGRALGIHNHLEIDYRAIALEPGDTFILATDGVYEHVRQVAMVAALDAHGDDLDGAARAIVAAALEGGSPDNLTVQVLRVLELPAADTGELQRMAAELPFPPVLQPRMEFDGYRIERELHASHRSHVYLATDLASGQTVVLKAPAIDLQPDAAAMERFLLEEWVARRVESAHLLRACPPARKRNYLYTVTEYVEGRTLRQWMVDHPRPDLDAVRDIAEQIARGLRALHRMEMVHQDLRPENVMIDATGTAKIIDFGAVQVSGLRELAPSDVDAPVLGTTQYAAPEYFAGEGGSARSDLFSLAVIVYEMLTGRLPYGAQVAQRKTLRYQSLLAHRRELPAWIDATFHKALQPQPRKRHADVSEFVFSLRTPDPELLARRHVPLIERDPVVFWKGLSLVLAVACLALLAFTRRTL